MTTNWKESSQFYFFHYIINKKTSINQLAVFLVDHYEIIIFSENVLKYQNTFNYNSFLSLYPTCIVIILQVVTLLMINAKMIINLSCPAIKIGIKASSRTRMIISFRLSITLKQLQQPIKLLLHLLTVLEVISGNSSLL